MKKEQILQTLIEVLHKVTDIPAEEISGESDLMDDLDMSSLEIMTTIAMVERAFHVKIRTKEMKKIVTLNDLAEFVREQTEK